MKTPLPAILIRSPRSLSVRVGLLLAVVMGVGGCVKDDPAFKAADLTTVPSLVGTWKSVSIDKPQLTLTFAEDRQTVENDRLKARPVKTTTEGASGASTAVVYTLSIESTQTDDAGKVKSTTMAARAYAVKVNDRTLLCIQNDDAEPEGLVPTFTFSKQLFLAVSVKGDAMTLNWPKVQVVLAPSVKLLDPPSGDEAPAPTVDAALKPDDKGNIAGATLMTSSPDRALWVYRQYSGRAGFWDQQGLVFSLVQKAPR